MAEKRLAVENLYMFKIDFILYVITINTIVVNNIYLHYNLITEPIYVRSNLTFHIFLNIWISPKYCSNQIVKLVVRNRHLHIIIIDLIKHLDNVHNQNLCMNNDMCFLCVLCVCVRQKEREKVIFYGYVVCVHVFG